jgi:hypothetical protein
MYVESIVDNEEEARNAQGDTIRVFDRITAELIKLGAERFAAEHHHPSLAIDLGPFYLVLSCRSS